MDLEHEGRLDAITRSGLVDTEQREVLDHLARMVATAMDVPTVVVSTVLDDKQIFSGIAGIEGALAEARRVPLSHSFCKIVVATEEPLIVTDARLDPRVRDSPAVDAGLIAYCGVPMVDDEGYMLGSICAVDGDARDWTEADVARLHRMVPVVRQQLAAYRRRFEGATGRPGSLTATDPDTPRRGDRQLGLARSTVDEFLAVAAHDLRSPIVTALSMLETLRTGDDRVPTEAIHDALRRTMSRSLRLLDRLHDHARAGTMQLELAPVDLNVVVRGVLDDTSAALTARMVRVHQESFLPMVDGDAVLLGQLIANIVRNAVRYAADGENEANVWISAASTDDGVHLMISDDGPGIDPEVAPEVFTAGVRGARGSDGIGLGLATCRTIAERHGGRIWVDEAPQGGTRVNIVLPPVTRTKQRRVLIVEDDEDVQLLYGMIMQHHTELGGTVSIVASLEEASRALESTPMSAGDLAIVDLHLPDGDAIALIRQLVGAGVQVHTVSSRATTDELMRAAADEGATVSTKSTILQHGVGQVAALLAGGFEARPSGA